MAHGSRKLVAIAATIAMASSGCAGVLEADARAVDTLASDHTSQNEKIIAGSVIGGTLLGTIAVVAVVVATSNGKKDPGKEVAEERIALGWNVERTAGEVRWESCSTVAMCNHEARSASADSVIEIERVGLTSPMFPDGSLGGDVVVYRMHIQRVP